MLAVIKNLETAIKNIDMLNMRTEGNLGSAHVIQVTVSNYHVNDKSHRMYSSCREDNVMDEAMVPGHELVSEQAGEVPHILP